MCECQLRSAKIFHVSGTPASDGPHAPLPPLGPPPYGLGHGDNFRGNGFRSLKRGAGARWRIRRMQTIGQASAHGLDRIGLTNLRKVYWNLPMASLVQEAVERREGLIAKDGPIVVKTGIHTGR